MNIPFKVSNFFCLPLLALCLFSFVSSKNGYQYECVSLNTDGYVILKMWNPAKGHRYKLDQARKDAIRVVLFSGIAGSGQCSTQPPLLSNTEEMAKFNAEKKTFFTANGDWNLFTRSASTDAVVNLDKKDKKWRFYHIAVSKNELRKKLEEQNIIKKLNNGF
jgi:hypothetical protein